jgi:hypothetical protein
MKLLRATLCGIALASLPALCLAQWQWIDKDGRKVFSDQSPPADIPAKNILKQPAWSKARVGSNANAAAEPASAPVETAKAAAPVPKLSGKDKELEEKRKLAEAAEADKRKAQEEEVAKVRAESCDRAKRAKVTLDSGVRISQTNAKGEREIMDDAQRAAEGKRLERVIASECKPA